MLANVRFKWQGEAGTLDAVSYYSTDPPPAPPEILAYCEQLEVGTAGPTPIDAVCAYLRFPSTWLALATGVEFATAKGGDGSWWDASDGLIGVMWFGGWATDSSTEKTAA